MSKTVFLNFKPLPFYKRHGFLFSFMLCLIPAVLSAVIFMLLRFSSAQTVEKVYSEGVYNGISSFLGSFAKITNRSIASIIWIVLVLSAIALIGSFIFFMIKSQNRLYIAGIYFNIIVFIVSLIMLLFSVLCMPNYYRLTFAEKAEITLSDYTVSDLEDMCRYLIEEANKQREKLDTTAVLEYKTLAENTKNSFNLLNEDYPFLGEVKANPKPFVFSEIMSVLNLTGFFFPYTGEANVNVHMPPTELPFTMCHELAHTRGFMRENEANFIGFLACMKSNDDFVRYSGIYTALSHSMNTLYSEDSESYFELRKTYSDKLSNDAATLSFYWQKYFDTPAADFSNAVNDAYLKANDLSDGIKSYGRMVDLLMANYLSEGSLF